MRRWQLLILVFAISPLVPVSEISGEAKSAQAEDSVTNLFSPASDQRKSQWISVNDDVMGGISNGSFHLSDSGCLVFEGKLSLENNGGFASIRTLPQRYDLQGLSGIKLRVRGDGRTYQFRIRTDNNVDGVAYRQEFKTTSNEWVEVDLPFADFVPTYRGRILSNVPDLVPAEISQIGFLIADKNTEPFRLEVESIEAYR